MPAFAVRDTLAGDKNLSRGRVTIFSGSGSISEISNSRELEEKFSRGFLFPLDNGDFIWPGTLATVEYSTSDFSKNSFLFSVGWGKEIKRTIQLFRI